MRKCSTGATDSHSRYTVQHRNVNLHGHLRDTLKNVLPNNRTEFHEEPPGGTRYSKRYHQLPSRRNDASHDGRNEKNATRNRSK